MGESDCPRLIHLITLLGGEATGAEPIDTLFQTASDLHAQLQTEMQNVGDALDALEGIEPDDDETDAEDDPTSDGDF